MSQRTDILDQVNSILQRAKRLAQKESDIRVASNEQFQVVSARQISPQMISTSSKVLIVGHNQTSQMNTRSPSPMSPEAYRNSFSVNNLPVFATQIASPIQTSPNFKNVISHPS